MIEIAQLHSDELKKKFHKTWFDDKYKYFHADTHYSEIEIDKDTWDRHQFVSLYAGYVRGYIGYCINRRTNNVDGLAVINFEDCNTTFSLDLGDIIIDIFERYKFNKLNFSVIVGNPIEASYDKLIEKYGGRVVGYFEKHAKLIDGKYYDEKFYEITAENYFKSKDKEDSNEKDIVITI